MPALDEIVSLKTRLENGVAEVELNLDHSMHGTHFIQLLQVRHNGRDVMEAQWGTGIAHDPYLVFYVAGVAPRDSISVEWHDNKGQSGQAAITLT